MRANASLSGTSLPTTCLLDKNIVRAVFEARVRVQRKRIPLPHQAQAAIVYQALQQAGCTVRTFDTTVGHLQDSFDVLRHRCVQRDTLGGERPFSGRGLVRGR